LNDTVPIRCHEVHQRDHSSRKRKIELKVKSSKRAKDPTSQTLRPVASIFQESESITDEKNLTEKQLKACQKEEQNDERNCEPEKEILPSDEYTDDNSTDNVFAHKQRKFSKLDRQTSKDKEFGETTGPTYKKSIDNIAEMLCDKLEALEVHAVHISPLKLVAVQIETMFEAWHNGALSAGYMQKFLAKMQGDMAHLEAQELSPPGWRVIWNRYSG